jgi:hypothetical protein
MGGEKRALVVIPPFIASSRSGFDECSDNQCASKQVQARMSAMRKRAQAGLCGTEISPQSGLMSKFERCTNY